MSFANVYEDSTFAEAYAQLDLPGTYLLATRELPGILRRQVTGRRALDFGCGAGRSSRLLRDLGFEVVGIDVSSAMVAQARRLDPEGDYRVQDAADPAVPLPGPVDVVFCSFPFDNIPGWDLRLRLLQALRGALAPGGRVVNLVSTPAIYTHEWVSFTTRAYPENHRARSGDVVRIAGRSVGDHRPVQDILWLDPDWLELYRDAGLQVLELQRPLAHGDEGPSWVNETRIPPWTLWVLAPEYQQ
jgi:SAM-dependent methyltransferase